MSTRLKVLVAGVGMVVMAMLVMGLLMLDRQQQLYEQEVENKARVLLAAVSVPCISALASNRIEEMDRVLSQFQRGLSDSTGILSVAVIDNDQRVVGHTALEMYGRTLEDEFAREATVLGESIVRTWEAGGKRNMRVSAPLVTANEGLEGIRWGTLIANVELDRVEQQKKEALLSSLMSVLGIALISALLLFFVLERLFLRPVEDLSKAAEAIRLGDLSVRTGMTGRDELHRLGFNFDQMAEELEAHTQKLEQLVDERTEALNATNIELQTANEKLEAMARSDPLTGLFNRRHMTEMLTHHVALAMRAGRPLSFIMLDVDYFKNYNDSHGHPAGDEVLKQLSEIIARRVRRTDVPCRYGGEEFAIMLPDTPAVAGRMVAEQLRKRIAAFPFAHAEEQPGGHLTVSIGIAEVNQELQDETELIQRADLALYAAKARGRNQVVHFEPGMASGTSSKRRET